MSIGRLCVFVGVESLQNICLDALVAAHEASPCGVDDGICRRQADAGCCMNSEVQAHGSGQAFLLLMIKFAGFTVYFVHFGTFAARQ